MALLDDKSSTRSDVPASTPKSGLRAIMPYTTALVIIVALYVAWTMWSRHQSEVEGVRNAQEKASEKERTTADDITQHGRLTFTTFYAANGVVKRGESTMLCYGVLNATSVKLDPPVEPVKPTERHCMDISPTKTTTYTITAMGSGGETKTQSLTVKVR